MTFEVNDEKLERIVKEHIQLTSIYLHQRNLPWQARLLIQQERTQDTMEMAVHTFREGKLRKMFYFIVEGTRYDPAWAYKFVKRALNKLWKLLPKSKKLVK
jgi:hypothetical protein